MSEEVQPITVDEDATAAANYDAEFWGVQEEEAVTEVPDEEATVEEGALQEEAASVPDEELPEKFRGKSAAEIASMYQHLEHFLGIPADARQNALQQAGIIESAESAATAEVPEVDETTQNRQQPIAKQRFSEMVQQEKTRLEALGYDAEKVTAELQSKREQLSAGAWSYAAQQDSYLQSAIKQGIQSALGELLPMITPAIGEQLYSADVANYFQSVPVHGVTAEEVTAEISRAGINPLEWRKAESSVKAAFIDRATKEIFYAKSLHSPAANAVKAPAQVAPVTVKSAAGNAINTVGNRLSQAFAGYLDSADLKDI